MTRKKELDEIEKEIRKIFEFEDEDDEMLLFECIDCGGKDEVPDFVVEEFSFDLKKGEEVETVCPFCNGTMRRAKDVPSE
ncbi:hypothetical protein [Sutcliffiella cohnii]|uniref:hypothetical protein n=1 Tax=Sutcliffiella cohnii TaxID=33932 RepID=UPI002E1DDF52|nr:hypothetical protein [Sutcliffiella cohnii]